MSRRKKKEITRAKAKAKERRRRAKPKAPKETVELRPGLRKTSEMITELGGGFVGAGEDLDDMQHRLNMVCTAWNLASLPPATRANALAKHMEQERKNNPTVPDAVFADTAQTIQKFVDKKLELFPDEDRPIVGGQVVPTGENRISINVVSGYRPQDVL
jgi:hypothetical protein